MSQEELLFAVSLTASSAAGVELDLRPDGVLVESIDANGVDIKIEDGIDCERLLLRAIAVRISPMLLPAPSDDVESCPPGIALLTSNQQEEPSVPPVI